MVKVMDYSITSLLLGDRMDGFDIMVIRRRAGLSQWRLAQRLGIPPQRLSDYETGKRPIADELKARILEVLHHSEALPR